MASNLQGKSPLRQDGALTPIPLNSMHTSTADFFRWHVVKALPLVPRDVVNFNVDTFLQGAPNPFPINGSMSYGMHAFFVPFRLVWKDWKFYYTDLQSGLTPPYFTLSDLHDVFNDTTASFIAGDPYYRPAALKYLSDIDSLSAIIPFMDLDKSDIPSEWLNLKLTAMPLRMCQMCWFDWMRDKMHISDNAKSSYCFDSGGHITLNELILLCTPKFRNFAKNQFTAAFDNPQEGAAANALGTLPSSSENVGFSGSSTAQVYVNGSAQKVGVGAVGVAQSGANNVIASTSINEVRYKNSLAQYSERLLFGGKSVKARCKALLGVSPTIEELQMANWLGGDEFPLDFNTHMAGSSTANSNTEFTGSAGAFGYNPRQQTIMGQKGQDISSQPNMGLKNITYTTDESGYLIVFGCVTPNVQYYQGLPKNWTAGLDTFNSDKFDFFHSDMENQPLEASLFYEICCDPMVKPKNVFGFQLMYSRYKQAYDSLAGDFILPESRAIMDNMHLGRDITQLLVDLTPDGGDPNEYLSPANLRQSSLSDAASLDNKFTISDSTKDHFIVNHKMSINVMRPMQLFCLPSLDSSLSKSTPKNLLETGGFSI